MLKLAFLAAIWSFWTERNRRCFDGKIANVYSIAEGIKSLAAAWVSSLPQFKGIPINIISQRWKEVAESRPH